MESVIAAPSSTGDSSSSIAFTSVRALSKWPQPTSISVKYIYIYCTVLLFANSFQQLLSLHAIDIDFQYCFTRRKFTNINGYIDINILLANYGKCFFIEYALAVNIDKYR